MNSFQFKLQRIRNDENFRNSKTEELNESISKYKIELSKIKNELDLALRVDTWSVI